MADSTELLKEYTFVDLSQRLPGPLAANLLSQLGASVLKIEDTNFPDPFEKGLPGVEDHSFATWYKNFNAPKEILKLNFKEPSDQKKILEKVSEAQGLVLGPPQKVLESIGLTSSFLEKLSPPFVSINLKATHDGQIPLHDLNALARTGQLKAQLEGKDKKRVRPPLIPMAGVSFAMRTALELVAALLKSEKEKKPLIHQINLLDSSHALFDLFHTKNPGEEEFSYLHNGRFPCYQIYQTKDGQYMALAAVEEKYWSKFIDLFNLPLEISDRFDESEKTFQVLIEFFQSKGQSEIMAAMGGHHVCLDPV